MSEVCGLRKHEKTQHALNSGRIISQLIVATRKCVKRSEFVWRIGLYKMVPLLLLLLCSLMMADIKSKNVLNESIFVCLLFRYYYYSTSFKKSQALDAMIDNLYRCAVSRPSKWPWLNLQQCNGTIYFNVIVLWRASFTRLDTESALVMHSLTGVFQDMLVWP